MFDTMLFRGLFLIAVIVYAIYSIWRSVIVVENSYKVSRYNNHRGPELRDIHRGWYRTFLKDEEYFRLWDIIVIIFHFPVLVFAFLYLLFKAGALEFIPFFKRVFGIKLFRIKKPTKVEVQQDEQTTPNA